MHLKKFTSTETKDTTIQGMDISSTGFYEDVSCANCNVI